MIPAEYTCQEVRKRPHHPGLMATVNYLCKYEGNKHALERSGHLNELFDTVKPIAAPDQSEEWSVLIHRELGSADH